MDFEAPVFNDIKIEKGPDGRIYVKADIFENRYLMDFQIYNYDIEKGTVGSMLTDYMIPVTSPVYEGRRIRRRFLREDPRPNPNSY